MKEVFYKIYNFLKTINILDLVFLIVLLVILIIPNTKFDDSKYEFIEGRPLAKLPSFVAEGKINKNFGKEFEDFYNDRFRKRSICIKASINIKSFINRRFENTIGIQGQNGWFFYKGNSSIANFQNKILFTDKELLKIKNNLESLNNWCVKNNIKLVVVVPPDKNRVYGEYYPPYIRKVNPKSRVELLKEYLDSNSKIRIIYPVEQMQVFKSQNNELLYYYTDTHWTQSGSYITYEQIMNCIKQKYPYVRQIDNSKLLVKKMTHKEKFGTDGDIVNGLDVKDISQFSHEYIFYEDCPKIYRPRKYNKKVAILGDSFSTEIYNWLSKSFDTKRFWYNETPDLLDNFSMKLWEDKILSYKPDILVVEFVERHSHKLLDLYKE